MAGAALAGIVASVAVVEDTVDPLVVVFVVAAGGGEGDGVGVLVVDAVDGEVVDVVGDGKGEGWQGRLGSRSGWWLWLWGW